MPEVPENNRGHTDTIWQRIDAVIILILENDKYLQSKRSKELTKVVQGKFKISPRTARRIIAEARKEIKKIGVGDKKKAFIKAIRDREYIIARAKQNLKETLSIPDLKKVFDVISENLRERDKLSGLYVEQVKESGEVTMKNIDMSKFTEHGLERLKRGDTVEEVLMDPKAVKQE